MGERRTAVPSDTVMPGAGQGLPSDLGWAEVGVGVDWAAFTTQRFKLALWPSEHVDGPLLELLDFHEKLESRLFLRNSPTL